MKRLILALFLLLNSNAYSQKPCELDQNVTDSLGTYKSTKSCIIFERSFAGNSTDIFFTLINNNGLLGLEVQFFQRSPDFIKATCFNNSSKIFLQLSNGKIVTLLHVGNESCGTLLVGENKLNNRITTARFVFAKDNFEDLKTSPVTFMRVTFSGDAVDYPFRSELTAEIDKLSYEPDRFFMDYLKCIEP